MTPFRPLRPRVAHGAPLVHLGATTSTNDRARELALGGAPHGTVVVAEHQTAGRGRQGRTWTAPPGRSLTLSVILRLEGSAETVLDLLPLAVAVAVCEAGEIVASVSCAIKWPNDVWVGDRKLGGILIESRPREGWAVIGIGLNVDVAVDELEPELRGSATSLRIETGGPVGRDRTLDALLERLRARLDQLRAQGKEELLAAYRGRELLSGRRISWTAGRRLLTGEAQGIDARGRLVVLGEDGEQITLDAGEVHLEAPGRMNGDARRLEG